MAEELIHIYEAGSYLLTMSKYNLAYRWKPETLYHFYNSIRSNAYTPADGNLLRI